MTMESEAAEATSREDDEEIAIEPRYRATSGRAGEPDPRSVEADG